MGLIDVQRQMLALCFDAEPSASALQALGGSRAWLVYRDMVRERMLRQIKLALPRTCELVPDAALQRAFTHHLAAEPPKTRYFRELVAAFVASALPLWAADASLHPACCDLARYELAQWQAADLPARPVQPYTELSFERAPVLSGALQLLAVSYAVHTGSELTPGAYCLAVHRAADNERPRTWSLTQVTYELLQLLVPGDRPLEACVKQLAARTRTPIDAAYLDTLCETLAQFLELGIVLGSR